MNALLALNLQNMSLVEIIILVVVVCAVVAIAYVVMKEVFGVTPPGWMVKIFWICVACVVAIFAIRFVASL